VTNSNTEINIRISTVLLVLSVFDKRCTKPYFFSFCKQTLKMAANDASGQGLQSAQKNRHQNIFEKVMSQKPIFSFLIFMLQSISNIRSTYNFKKCTDEMNYKYFIFIYRT
jgi:hypothetical protein